MTDPRMKLDLSIHLALASEREPSTKDVRKMAVRQVDQSRLLPTTRLLQDTISLFSLNEKFVKSRNNSKYSQDPVPTSQKEQRHWFYHTCFINV